MFDIKNHKATINFKDFKFDYNHLTEFLYAYNKTTEKRVVIQFFECSQNTQTVVNEMIDKYCYNLPDIVKIIGFYLPLVKEKNAQCIDIDPSDDLWKEIKQDPAKTAVIVYDFFENIKFSGFKKNGEKLNPTIKSKIIYGIASIIKQIHKKKSIIDYKNEKCFIK